MLVRKEEATFKITVPHSFLHYENFREHKAVVLVFDQAQTEQTWNAQDSIRG
jgi:hypothetical protein